MPRQSKTVRGGAPETNRPRRSKHESLRWQQESRYRYHMFSIAAETKVVPYDANV
jgi:hypothetical protein